MGQVLIDDMGVDNVGFLIENLGADAAELQYLRELVQNAFEAIARTGRDDGKVVVDFDVVNGIRKLRISDNGDGMTPDDVRAHINHLSASGGIQAFDKNFGIGAKITAAVRNPHGVIYRAWKDGVGSLTVLGRQEGRYGRIGHQSADGSIDFWLPLPDEEKHEIITRSGVSVVLLGKSDQDDTTIAPPGSDLPSQWVSAYLERRYFEIPRGIEARVLRPREIYDSAREERRAISDTVRGQRHYLDKHSDASGCMALQEAGADVFWWLLSEEIMRGGKTWNNRGHVAALYQGELYEVRSTRGGSALKDFGIYAGHSRIVIYVQPRNTLKANVSRTALILQGNRGIDYPGIGAAFADRMPDELAAFMAGQVTAESGDHRKSIRKAIQEVEQELNSKRYRASVRGRLDSFEPDAGGLAAIDREMERPIVRARSAGTADAAGRLGSDYLRLAREELERRRRAEMVDADPTPVIKWVTGEESLAGRAASYVSNRHMITANADFDVYCDLVAWATDEAKRRAASEIDEEALRRIAEDEVKRWFEQALSEVVVVVRPLSHDSRWGAKALDVGLSDEGLTAAVVSHRWHMMTAIRRGLAGRLGSKRTEVA